MMKQRLADLFPYLLAIVLPLAGLLVGIWRIQQGDRAVGQHMVLLSIVATGVWLVILSGA